MKKVFALLFILTLPTTLLAAGINTALNRSDINKQLEENLSRIENGPGGGGKSKSNQTDNPKEKKRFIKGIFKRKGTEEKETKKQQADEKEQEPTVEVEQIESEIKKLTQETIDKIKEYCKEEENKDVCDKQDETIKAINEAQDKALEKLKDIK